MAAAPGVASSGPGGSSTAAALEAAKQKAAVADDKARDAVAEAKAVAELAKLVRLNSAALHPTTAATLAPPAPGPFVKHPPGSS